MAIIDFHCHLDLYKDSEDVIKRSQDAGIYVLSVTTVPSAWLKTKEMASSFPRIKTALGLHPQLAHLKADELSLFERLLPQTEYVGEIGLDGSKDYGVHADVQEKVFISILEMMTREGGRIMSIHSRGAASEVLAALEKYPESGTPVLHWFSGNKRDLQKAIEIGCWFSVGPKMFSSKKGIELISHLPLNKIIFETDGPFAKTKNKKPYEPVDTLLLAEELGRIHDLDGESCREIILSSFRKLVSVNKFSS